MFYLHMAFMDLMCVFVVWAVVVAKRKGDGWLLKHRALAVAGVVCGLIGVGLMFYNKMVQEWPHFSSPHGIGGGIAALLLICTPVLGYLSMKGNNSLRPLHRVFGRITAILSLLVLVTGIVYLLKHLGIIK